MLIDKIVRPGAIVNERELDMPLISRWLRSAYVLLATNVADTIRDMTSGEFDVYRDLPNIAPSFENMFVEWSEKSKTGALAHYALLINSADRHKLPEAECWTREFRDVDVRWSCNAFLFQFSLDKSTALYLGHQFWGVGDQGQFTDHRAVIQEYPKIVVADVVKGMACTPSTGWTITMKQRKPDVQEEQMGGHMLALTKVPLMSMCFLHARNVQVVKSPAPTAHQAKAWRKKDKPFFRYHTITIDSRATRVVTSGAHAVTGRHQAVHICRGHFKRFTPEKPLLGKHVGVYWWPMVLRGSKEDGVVVKDYQVKP